MATTTSPTVYDYLPPAQTDADILRAQKKAMGEYGTQALVGLGLGAGQLAMSYIPTAATKENEAELARLKKLRAKGDLGLSATEKQHYEHAIMNPVRAMAADAQRAQEARLAASGTASAADVVRTQRETQRAINEAAARAGTQIESANLQRAAEQRQEIAERTATKAEREKDRVALAAQTLVGLAPNVGRVLAAGAQKGEMNDADIIAMMRATDARGLPVYPGLRDLSLSEARALIAKGDTAKLFAKRDDADPVPPSSIPATE